MPTLIQLAKSKSIWFANALIACGIIQQLGGLVIPAEYQGLVMSAAYANDAAAAAGGIPVGGLYRIGNAIQIRLV